MKCFSIGPFYMFFSVLYVCIYYNNILNVELSMDGRVKKKKQTNMRQNVASLGVNKNDRFIVNKIFHLYSYTIPISYIFIF